MGLDFTTALARLLKDRELRGRFRADPDATARAMGLAADAHAALATVDREALDRQAEALLRKRFSEMRGWLPNTLAAIEADAFGAFSNYAQALWPSGHLRHPADAAAFGRYLAQRGTIGVDEAEVNRAAFVARGGRVWVRCVRDVGIADRPHAGVQFLFRFRGRIRQAFLYLSVR